jgi:hypothetical protein
MRFFTDRFKKNYFLSAYPFISSGYLQCSSCAVSTFVYPLNPIQRAAVVGAMRILNKVSGVSPLP